MLYNMVCTGPVSSRSTINHQLFITKLHWLAYRLLTLQIDLEDFMAGLKRNCSAYLA
jgi:DUF1365 family protein